MKKMMMKTLLFQSLVLCGLMSVVLGSSASALYAADAEMTDQAISDKIDDELLLDPGVIASKIHVSTTNGIVEMTGQVNNLLSKERAARVAEAVKGVRSVVNRIEVVPSLARTDDAVKEDVEQALLADPATPSPAAISAVAQVISRRLIIRAMASDFRSVSLATLLLLLCAPNQAAAGYK